MMEPSLVEKAQKVLSIDLFLSSTESCTLFEKQNVFLVAGGLKPVGFVSSSHKQELDEGAYEYAADDPQFVTSFLTSLGLFSHLFTDEHTTDAIISLNEEYVAKMVKDQSNDVIAGVLYGYPETAVNAYITGDKSQRLSEEEEDKILISHGIPTCFPHFSMSKAHFTEELPVIQKWYEFCKLYGVV